MTTYRFRNVVSAALAYVYLIIFLVFTLFPIIWMILTSIKPQVVAFSLPPKWVFKPTFEHYRTLFSDRLYPTYLVNSVVVASVSTILGLLIGVCGGYALDRGVFRRKRDFAFWVISTRMAPATAVVLPLYIIMSKVGLLGTRTALIILYLTFNIPLAVWMMRGFFAGIPVELEEAARVDGCSRFQAFRQIVMPLAAPGIGATAILCFIFSWNEFIFALVLSGPETKTLPVTLPALITPRGTLWGQVAASGTIVMLPMLVFGMIVRKHLIRGLTFGAVKQ